MSSPVLWYATRATGIVTLVLLTATVVLGVLNANRVHTPRWPGFALQDLHRRVSLVALIFLGLHITTSVADTFVHIGWAAVVVPFSSPYQRPWVALGTIGVDLALAVGASSLFRPRISPLVWRALHWLAYVSWPVAMAHAFGMGTDMRLGWALALGVGCILAVLAAVSWRIARSARDRRRALAHAGMPRRRPGPPVKYLAS